MHAQARNFVQQAVSQYGPFTGDVVELGSQDVNGGVKDLFNKSRSYLGIDIMPGPNVDLVIDAADWKPAKKYCCIVSTELFEHTANWPKIVNVVAKALAPNGIFILTCATRPRKPHSAHTDRAKVKQGEYYKNVGLQDFINATNLAGLRAETSVDHLHGDLYAVCKKVATND